MGCRSYYVLGASHDQRISNPSECIFNVDRCSFLTVLREQVGTNEIYLASVSKLDITRIVFELYEMSCSCKLFVVKIVYPIFSPESSLSECKN